MTDSALLLGSFLRGARLQYSCSSIPAHPFTTIQVAVIVPCVDFKSINFYFDGCSCAEATWELSFLH